MAAGPTPRGPDPFKDPSDFWKGYSKIHLATENSHRTHEEIMAQLERRYSELKAETERRAVDPVLLYPCKTCRFRSGSDTFPRCSNALVNGYDTESKDAVDYLIKHETNSLVRKHLCGPEKALWEPKLTWWQRLWRWLEGVFG